MKATASRAPFNMAFINFIKVYTVYIDIYLTEGDPNPTVLYLTFLFASLSSFVPSFLQALYSEGATAQAFEWSLRTAAFQNSLSPNSNKALLGRRATWV